MTWSSVWLNAFNLKVNNESDMESIYVNLMDLWEG